MKPGDKTYAAWRPHKQALVQFWVGQYVGDREDGRAIIMFLYNNYNADKRVVYIPHEAFVPLTADRLIKLRLNNNLTPEEYEAGLRYCEQTTETASPSDTEL